MNINETIAEVLRLNREATQGPWEYHYRWGNIFDESSDPPFSCRRGETRREDDGAAIVGADNVEVVYEGTFDPYEQTAGVLGAVPADAALIAHYRTAAPALAREVQRLQGQIERLHGQGCDCHFDRYWTWRKGYREGQEAMRERAATLCEDWEEDSYCEGWREMEQGAQHCADAIHALEVE